MSQVSVEHIELRTNKDGQSRAYVAGTEFRVQDIYAQSEVHGKSPEQIVTAFPQLTLSQVHAALAYYFDNRQSILDEMRQDEASIHNLKRQLGPGPLENRLRGDDDGSAVSPG